MFSALKEKLRKNSSLRSVLAAAALFTAGAPTVAEAAPKDPQKITQTSTKEADKLVASYIPLCVQLEGNLPYCYKDKDVVTAGAGVHLKDYSAALATDLKAIKLTLKKGTVVNLEKVSRLRQMADANWNLAKTYKQFPEVEKVQKIKLKDCVGECPKATDKTWDKENLIVLPSQVLTALNKEAACFCVKKAQEYHPKLFQLPPSARLVIVDLIYNLGHKKYFDDYPKFKTAVQKADLAGMKNECKTKNNRRDTIRECLIDSAILLSNDSNMTLKNLLKKIRVPVVKKAPKLSPNREKSLWKELDTAATQNSSWYQLKKVNRMVAWKSGNTVKK